MAGGEVGDTRLRRALMRALVGQTGRRAETIVLPLELLRQLKPSEFTDTNEYHHWQRRQLKVLETGLSLHPSTPLDHPNSAAFRLREVVQMSELKPIDTSKNSEAMCTLCSSVLTLAWRSPNNFPTSDVCHWADGYPLNVYLYLSLIHSIFDLRDETVVLDELDELIELMKKTWVVLGINKMIHDVCFTWALFEQYVITGQIEPDLMCAVLAMLTEVASDIKKADREPGYLKILSATLSSMQGWAEKKLMNYHEGFEKGLIGTMENVLSLALSIAKISEDVPSMRGGLLMDRDGGITMNLLESRVDMYIRSSLKSAFAKIFENGHWQIDSTVMEIEEYPNEVLLQLTKEIKALAIYEKENFSPLLKQWHPVPSAVAVATIHSCFGIVLKQYMARITTLTNESIRVLQTAGKLEKILIQMVVEDSSECDDGGKGVVTEMIPYEVDSVVKNLMKNWINERLRIGRECFLRAKETESWNPKSKSEPYAQSAVDLMMVVKVTVDEFIDIPSSVREELVQDLVDGLENLFQDYTSFVSSCGGGRGRRRCEGGGDADGMATDSWSRISQRQRVSRGGMGAIVLGVRVLMPPTTGRWNRSDPNTVLRVLCHRNDEVASWFLKKTFQLPKRR
ncbi:uncharacterized protein A4U43_C01F7590 [Asparagus officinalis]|uniref:MHD1 domain-containing protein n=1 Tax=Asparagus officinalis TaxID=4686 RepID=A0A5P1FQ64_ASPOF|nr:uncharacterized protein A4U43_C01F7590 [Asparagus officinalis]